MRKVLLIPLLMFIPLAGVQALSKHGTTPGAAVLRGSLAGWSVIDPPLPDTRRDQRIEALDSPVGHLQERGVGETEAQLSATDLQTSKRTDLRNAAQVPGTRKPFELAHDNFRPMRSTHLGDSP